MANQDSKRDEFDADREWSSTGDSDFLRKAHHKVTKDTQDKRTNARRMASLDDGLTRKDA